MLLIYFTTFGKGCSKLSLRKSNVQFAYENPLLKRQSKTDKGGFYIPTHYFERIWTNLFQRLERTNLSAPHLF